MEQSKETQKKKIFFITSNQSRLNHLIKYEIKTCKCFSNLKSGKFNAEMNEEVIFQNENFTIFVNSIEILSECFKGKDQDPNGNTSNAKITLSYDKINFPGSITFNHTKNNFLYDFYFEEYHGWTKSYSPPTQMKFSKLEQLKFYIKYLKDVLMKQKKDPLFKDLITDSQLDFFGKKVYLDFF